MKPTNSCLADVDVAEATTGGFPFLITGAGMTKSSESEDDDDDDNKALKLSQAGSSPESPEEAILLFQMAWTSSEG
jgi:hypothetical protein